jgi:hypothetical protein
VRPEPASRLATWQVIVVVPEQPEPASTSSTWSGKGSVTTTSRAVAGPLLKTSRRYLYSSPGSAVSMSLSPWMARLSMSTSASEMMWTVEDDVLSAGLGSLVSLVTVAVFTASPLASALTRTLMV